ncbi:hypothetical protein M9458_033463, partial [Cirrhinus mrigala]
MAQTKEISEDLVVAHQAGKGYKTISIDQTDCVQMEEIQDHSYLPQKWSTNKDHSK